MPGIPMWNTRHSLFVNFRLTCGSYMIFLTESSNSERANCKKEVIKMSYAYVGCRTTKERNARGKGLKVYEISAQVGYKNVDYFHQKFKKLKNVSPAEYRRTYSK